LPTRVFWSMKVAALERDFPTLKRHALGRRPSFCRSERSEGPHRRLQREHFETPDNEILRCAQDDKMDTESVRHKPIAL
jgi:hypothetical protein